METENTNTPEQAPANTIDPSVIQRYQQELAAAQQRNMMLAEENNLRRLREMRLYEEQQAAASRPVEEDIPIDPEAKKVLDKILGRTLAPLQQELSTVKYQLAQSQAEAEARKTIETIRQHAPFIDEIGDEIRREFQSLPQDEQQLLSRSPMAMVKMAHLIYNTKGRGGNAQKAAAQMATPESGSGATVIPAINGDGPWWRAKGYQNLNAEERARADAEIARMRGR